MRKDSGTRPPPVMGPVYGCGKRLPSTEAPAAANGSKGSAGLGASATGATETPATFPENGSPYPTGEGELARSSPSAAITSTSASPKEPGPATAASEVVDSTVTLRAGSPRMSTRVEPRGLDQVGRKPRPVIRRELPPFGFRKRGLTESTNS